MSKVVVDVLEVIDVDEQRTGDDAWLACRPREELLGAVEHQRAVRKPGQPVVQSLMGELAVLLGELAGLLAHERQGSRASG